ncbi:DM13 domain-containing protein [Leptolyngbya sp. FACHB-261]|uniref:DM13 domain-containing protein n=1 Tax=Leptolyngbya sp. FACHB-261 TaxID=2692806 RepID=UPI00168622C5|nr:DM13 domain-containing protein [Leptolyngbya sp. FACHB-261]MBD2100444.1 DM13 domain-containing protein [Leptolyngbya sp. FACHB-261]
MKLIPLLLLGFAAFLTPVLSSPGHAFGEREALPPAARDSELVAQSQITALMTGTFAAAEKPTAGTVRIVRQGGHRFLELSSAFRTDTGGPDLHVLLTTADRPPQSYSATTSGSYINLGKLQSYSGTQRYPIPDSVNLANFKSVSVWCRMANATFGYALLRPASTASAQ